MEKKKQTKQNNFIRRPRTDDELHTWLVRHLGITIPRGKVCENHQAPFDFLADLFFERIDSAVLVANRGGAKTFIVAILHLLNGLFKPGCESATIGAIENQAKRAYNHFLKLSLDRTTGRPIKEIKKANITETLFKNGSRLEIMSGTKNAVNGPHPFKVHFDEVELADYEVYQESRNMSISGWTTDGNHTLIKAQDIITSTRKYAKGLMQEIIDEVDHAVAEGKAPPFKKYQWCIFETAAQVENCQVARPDLPECERCDCEKVSKGNWETNEGPKERTLRDICGGKFYRSRGWQPFDDIKNTFTQTSITVWEAQQECIKPSSQNLYIPNFTKERFGLRDWVPNPELGPIYMSVDFGGTNPHAVNWYQRLDYEVEAESYDQGRLIRLKEGTIVCFDEIYAAQIGNNELMKKIIRLEESYRHKFKRFPIEDRFADPQAKAARLDFAHSRPPLSTHWFGSREFDEHVKLIQEAFGDNLIYVNISKCPMFCEEIQVWRKNPVTGRQIDIFNHVMSNFRYALSNIHTIELSRGRGNSPGSAERKGFQRDYSSDPSMPKSDHRKGATGTYDPEDWQRRFYGIHPEATTWRH